MIRCLLICLFLLHAGYLLAQTDGEFVISQYGTENGLPSNGIRGLQLDERTGFLWIATEAGIVRYNGLAFETFNQQNTSFIASERILFLVRSLSGNMYGGDMKGNIFLVDRNKLRPWHRSDSVKNRSPAHLLLASAEMFSEGRRMQACGTYSLVDQMYCAASDTSLFIFSDQGLYYFSRSMQCPRMVDTRGIVPRAVIRIGKQVMLVDNQDKLYLVKNGGNILVNVFIGADAKLIPGSNIQSKYGSGSAYEVKDDKIWKLGYNEGRFTKQLVARGIPRSLKIRFIDYSEQLGQLFIGTDSKGVYIVRRKVVRTMKLEDTLANQRSSYYSQIELPGNRILTSEGHVLGFNEGKMEISGLKGKYNNSAMVAADSSVYFLRHTAGQPAALLFRYHFKSGRLDSFPKISGHSRLSFLEKKNHLLVATSLGLSLLEGDSLRYLVKYKQRFKDDPEPYAIEEAEPGIFLVATCGALVKFDLNKQAYTLVNDGGQQCFRTIWKVGDLLFLGTYGNGYYGYRHGKLVPMPLDKHKYLLYAHCFLPDGEGNCWISTNRGLFRTRTEDMVRAFEQSQSQIYYQYFGRSEGMSSTEMNGGCAPCAIRMRNGLLSFPTMDGLVWVNPAKVSTFKPSGPIFVDKVSGDDVVYPDGDTLMVFKPNTKRIQVKLGLLLWGGDEAMSIESRIRDRTDWRQVDEGSHETITLENLPYGNHILEIRKLNGFGARNYTYKALSITIRTPWYRQLWFYGLAMLLLAALTLIFYRWRVNRYRRNAAKLEEIIAAKTKELVEKNEALENLDRIKTRLISIISHDIITPLKFIHLAGAKFVQKARVNGGVQDLEVIEEIAETSNELQMLSSNILNWMKYQNDQRKLRKEYFSLHDQVEQVLTLFNTSILDGRIALENKVDQELTLFQYYEPTRVIIHNLIANAINFTDRGKVTISSATEPGTVIIVVADEGIGMTQDQVNHILTDSHIIASANVDNRKGHGLGFLIIKDLCRMIGAEIHINSAKGEGTTVAVKISI